jgi:hypothetical protein
LSIFSAGVFDRQIFGIPALSPKQSMRTVVQGPARRARC